MSGPFGVNMTLISGQELSGEIVVAASTFLSTGALTINLVATEEAVREEILKALDIFGDREGFYYHEKPDDFIKRINKPSSSISTKGLFWLALDKQGEDLANKIFEANGELPDKRVYQFVHKLNLIQQTIPPPPQIHLPLGVWEESRRQHFSASVSYRKLKPMESYHSYMDHQVPLTPEQKLYYDWCESLYESLILWQDTIKSIQSDFS